MATMQNKRARTIFLTPDKNNRRKKYKRGNVSFASPIEISAEPVLQTQTSMHEDETTRRLSSTPSFHPECKPSSTNLSSDFENRPKMAGASVDILPSFPHNGVPSSIDSASDTSQGMPIDRSLEDAILNTTSLKSKKNDQRGLTVSFAGVKSSGDQDKNQASQKHSPRIGTEPLQRLSQSGRGGLARSVGSTRKARKMMDYSALDLNLGYDWIAGAIDAEEDTSVLKESDGYFKEMKEFRIINKHECVRPKVLSPTKVTPKKSQYSYYSRNTGDEEDVTLCSASYVLNDRMFPVPVHLKNDAEPCPVCEDCNKGSQSDKEPSRFVKISVPRISLQMPHRWKRLRFKGQGDTLDTMGLSSHCVPGWDSACPVMIPSQDTVDLSSSLSAASPSKEKRSKNLLNTSHHISYTQKNV